MDRLFDERLAGAIDLRDHVSRTRFRVDVARDRAGDERGRLAGGVDGEGQKVVMRHGGSVKASAARGGFAPWHSENGNNGQRDFTAGGAN